MSLRPTDRARRIAEPALLAAIAAVIHLGDLLLAMGMLGAALCPLPHAISVRRHGLRAGALGALSAVCALGIMGGLVEAGYHLFLFVAPGLAAGWALRSERPLSHLVLGGTLGCAVGVAGTYYVLDAAVGVPDGLEKMGEWVVSMTDMAAAPFHWAAVDGGHFDHVPGLSTLETRTAHMKILVEPPVGICVASGALVFFVSWLVSAMVLVRMGEEVRPPPIPLGARLPRSVALLYLATFVVVPGEPWWAVYVRANLNLVLGAVCYLAGYLNLLVGARGRPAGALLALVAAIPLYYVSIWVGLLSALRPATDTEGSDGARNP